MRVVAKIFMYLTLWCDLCLILGVVFTGNYHGLKMSALISTGNFSVDSHTPGGATFIMFISIWTGALAICGLLALRKSQFHNLAPTP